MVLSSLRPPLPLFLPAVAPLPLLVLSLFLPLPPLPLSAFLLLALVSSLAWFLIRMLSPSPFPPLRAAPLSLFASLPVRLAFFAFYVVFPLRALFPFPFPLPPLWWCVILFFPPPLSPPLPPPSPADLGLPSSFGSGFSLALFPPLRTRALL